MDDLLTVLAKAVNMGLPVLLYGEAGTGKRFLAVQAAGDAAPVIDCDAGFSAARDFPSAGPVVLDKVDDLDAEGQLGLLAALKAAQAVTTIATARSRLDEAASRGAFRSDLYYRLAACPLAVPPLRNRREDIVPLARLFCEKWRGQFGESSPSWALATGDETALQNYRWPGNVRELENAVLRACALGKLSLGALVNGGGENETAGDLREATQKFRRGFVTRILDETKGNQTKAAKRLGIQRSYLSRLMKELEVRYAN
jgi:DNA-binding NtrC family response regulator